MAFHPLPSTVNRGSRRGSIAKSLTFILGGLAGTLLGLALVQFITSTSPPAGAVGTRSTPPLVREPAPAKTPSARVNPERSGNSNPPEAPAPRAPLPTPEEEFAVDEEPLTVFPSDALAAIVVSYNRQNRYAGRFYGVNIHPSGIVLVPQTVGRFQEIVIMNHKGETLSGQLLKLPQLLPPPGFTLLQLVSQDEAYPFIPLASFYEHHLAWRLDLADDFPYVPCRVEKSAYPQSGGNGPIEAIPLGPTRRRQQTVPELILSEHGELLAFNFTDTPHRALVGTGQVQQLLDAALLAISTRPPTWIPQSIQLPNDILISRQPDASEDDDLSAVLDPPSGRSNRSEPAQRLFEEYDTDSVKGIYQYADGKLTGVSAQFRLDGSPIFLANYNSARRDGILRYWDSDGDIAYLADYRLNRKHGPCCYFENGRPVLIDIYSGDQLTAAYLVEYDDVQQDYTLVPVDQDRTGVARDYQKEVRAIEAELQERETAVKAWVTPQLIQLREQRRRNNLAEIAPAKAQAHSNRVRASMQSKRQAMTGAHQQSIRNLGGP